jgi:hypothetical protein
VTATRIACPGSCGWVLDFDVAALTAASLEDLYVVNGLTPTITAAQWAGLVDQLVLDHVGECEPLRRWLWFERRVNWRSFIQRVSSARRPVSGDHLRRTHARH